MNGDPLADMTARALKTPRHIVLAEGLDPRIVEGAVRAAKSGIAAITLLGPSDKVRAMARTAGDKTDLINIIDPAGDEALTFANDMVQLGQADGSVAGAVHTTGDVVRSALRTIGVHPDFTWVSSLFLMIMPETSNSLTGGVVFSDCGLIPDPDAEQLAEIAVAAAHNAKQLLGLEPKIALLSFATGQSASHPAVDKVAEAALLLKAKYPKLIAEGPIQFDAAIIPEVAQGKLPGSKVAGKANVFVFPDLNSGNIAYKIAERLGGATAIGPVLQGLNKPANDLSRGCDVKAVYNMILVTVLQAQMTGDKARS